MFNIDQLIDWMQPGKHHLAPADYRNGQNKFHFTRGTIDFDNGSIQRQQRDASFCYLQCKFSSWKTSKEYMLRDWYFWTRDTNQFWNDLTSAALVNSCSKGSLAREARWALQPATFRCAWLSWPRPALAGPIYVSVSLLIHKDNICLCLCLDWRCLSHLYVAPLIMQLICVNICTSITHHQHQP